MHTISFSNKSFLRSLVICIFFSMVLLSCNDNVGDTSLGKSSHKRKSWTKVITEDRFVDELGLNNYDTAKDSIEMFIWYNLYFDEQELLFIRMDKKMNWSADHITYFRVDHDDPTHHPELSREYLVGNISKTSIVPQTGWSNFASKVLLSGIANKLLELPEKPVNGARNDDYAIVVEVATQKNYNDFPLYMSTDSRKTDLKDFYVSTK